MRGDPAGVLLADHDPLARRVVRSELERTDKLTIVAEVADPAELLALAQRADVAVIVMELRVGGDECTRLIEELRARAAAQHVVIFASGADPDAVVSAIRAGAGGFVAKDDGAAALLTALEKVLAGEVVLPGWLAMQIVELLRLAPQDGLGMRPVVSEFTAREWEILDLMSRGASTNEIADELVVSPHTVYSHVKHIMQKLGVHTRKAAVERARGACAGGSSAGAR